MNLAATVLERHTAKAYDDARRIPDAQVRELLEALRNSPSSVNSQPWHFVVASDAAGKARVAKGAVGRFASNAPKILGASHVIVLCARTDLSPEYLEALLAQEERDGRYPTPEARAGQQKGRQSYVDLHRYDYKDTQHWMEKQVYVALGTLLLGAATLGIDATPMEGFDPRALDAELDLRARGYTSVVLCSLGYHGAQDFNAALPKSRLPEAAVTTFL